MTPPRILFFLTQSSKGSFNIIIPQSKTAVHRKILPQETKKAGEISQPIYSYCHNIVIILTPLITSNGIEQQMKDKST